MRALWNDVKYALRQLRRSPGFVAVTVLSLAIGIGANTAIFSTINGVLLKSLPVRDPQELHALGWTGSNASVGGLTSDSVGRSQSGQMFRSVFPYPLYRDFAENAEGISELFAFSYFEDGMTIRAAGAAASAHGLMVSGNFFEAFGARVLIGQPIAPHDDRIDAEPVAVITYRFWQRHYACDPHVLGQRLMINHAPFTVVGVLPKHHKGPLSGDPSDLYVPIAAQPRLTPGDNMLARSDEWWVRIMGRLAPGASEARAATSLGVLFEGFLSTSDNRIHQPKIVLAESRRGLGMLYSGITAVLVVLQVLVGLILLIACANVAALVLARGAGRQHEMSVRAAMGAGRWRLIRLSLVESFILSLAAGIVSLAISRINRVAISGFLAQSLARTQEHLSYMGDDGAVGMHLDQGTDGAVLGFVLGAAMLTTFLFGLVPALRAGHANPSEGLKDSSSVAPRLRLGKCLIAMQAGLATLLVIGAGLLTRSVVKLHKVDPGYDTEQCLTFNLKLLDSTPGADDAGDFFDRVRTSIAGIPGVRSVALSTPGLPGAAWWADVSFPGRNEEEVTMPMYFVSEGWLDTMGVTLLSGRDFNRTDTRRSSPVAIVNEAFVHECFAGENPVGRPISYWNDDTCHIVGICGNHKVHLRWDASPIIYLAYNQRPHDHVTFVVRSVLPPLSLVPAVRRAVATHSPDLPLEDVATQEQLLAKSIVMERFFALLCGSLAGLALLLSCIGIFGLMAYNVTRRTGEIGIRMALGARPKDVAWPILRQALVLVGTGLAVGMPLTLAATRILRGVFFGIAPHDPVTIIVAIAVLLGVALLAAWIPARRAAKVDPMEALRYE